MFLIKGISTKLKINSNLKITQAPKEYFAYWVIDKGVLNNKYGNALMANEVSKT